MVAEGVETESQRRLLLAAGCPQLQGYLFCRPQPARDLLDLLRHESALGVNHLAGSTLSADLRALAGATGDTAVVPKEPVVIAESLHVLPGL